MLEACFVMKIEVFVLAFAAASCVASGAVNSTDDFVVDVPEPPAENFLPGAETFDVPSPDVSASFRPIVFPTERQGSPVADHINWRSRQIFHPWFPFSVLAGVKAGRSAEQMHSTHPTVSEDETTVVEEENVGSLTSADAVVVQRVEKVKDSGIKFPHVPTSSPPSPSLNPLDPNCVKTTKPSSSTQAATSVPAAKPTTTSSFVPQERCSRIKSKAYFRGKCVSLLAEGPPHCSPDEWLIFDDVASQEAKEPIAKCSVKPCLAEAEEDADYEVHERRSALGLDGKCHKPEDLEGECKPNEVLMLDFFGRSICECEKHRVFWAPDERCYHVYRRGPCRQGEILVLEPTTMYLACQVNPCEQEGEVMWRDGSCYKIDTPGPCSNSEILAIDDETLRVTCVGLDLRNLFSVPWKSCPVGSRRDFLGQCQSGLQWGSGNSHESPCPFGTIRNAFGRCVTWFRG